MWFEWSRSSRWWSVLGQSVTGKTGWSDQQWVWLVISGWWAAQRDLYNTAFRINLGGLIRIIRRWLLGWSPSSYDVTVSSAGLIPCHSVGILLYLVSLFIPWVTFADNCKMNKFVSSTYAPRLLCINLQFFVLWSEQQQRRRWWWRTIWILKVVAFRSWLKYARMAKLNSKKAKSLGFRAFKNALDKIITVQLLRYIIYEMNGSLGGCLWLWMLLLLACYTECNQFRTICWLCVSNQPQPQQQQPRPLKSKNVINLSSLHTKGSPRPELPPLPACPDLCG